MKNTSDQLAFAKPSRTIGNGLIFGVMAIVVATVGYYLFHDQTLRFKEEVLLSSGEIIEIDRTIKTQSLGEIGGSGGWESALNRFVISSPTRPGNPPIWQSEIGLIPMVFDRDPDSGVWFVVATFYTCEAWYALGRPKLPYAEFRMHDGQWRKMPLEPKLVGREANVMTGVRSGGEPKLLTLAEKRVRNAEQKIAPEYRKIAADWTTGC
jgi:hypothetical protein